LRPKPAAARWLHGPRFAILPPRIVAARDLSRFPETLRILVVCGGSDPNALSARIVERLRDAPAPIDVVVGPMFSPALRARLDALAQADASVCLHDAPPSLVDLYQAATLVVGRAGLIRYEAACLGRNGIYLSEGSAYSDYFAEFTRSGAAEIHVGVDDRGVSVFFARLESLRDPAALAVASLPNLRAYPAVDGQGAQRVAEAIRRYDTETTK
jgi:spore coat polysaccharide biosynthesis predicted glycosyltransferase SpsG